MRLEKKKKKKKNNRREKHSDTARGREGKFKYDLFRCPLPSCSCKIKIRTLVIILHEGFATFGHLDFLPMLLGQLCVIYCKMNIGSNTYHKQTQNQKDTLGKQFY